MFNSKSESLISDEELAEPTLVDKLLAEQKHLSAVEKFSQKHEKLATPAQKPHYQDLIPIRKPSTGEQYSFSVDLDKCTGCKACVVACHSRNGLDEKESWRDVGKIRSLSTNEQQTVTTACHHCADPGCLSGCPVGAYEKMPDTGIVRHLDDQCIGCEYCSLKCPYDVPKYNKDLGIVRKCDMCHDRLEVGEAPACVQSCPNGAIKIDLVSKEEIYKRVEEEESMIAGAYRSDYTFPSTQFTSKRKLPSDMVAVDEQSIEASHKHTPLSWMLMLTQVGVGISVFELLLRIVSSELSIAVGLPMLGLAIVLSGIGLTASIFHLGSPFGAWRVFLGLKTSWLSREVVLFGAWMPALLGYGAAILLRQYHQHLPSWVPVIEEWAVLGAGVTAAVFGLVSVFCSIMVYVDTKRAFWSFSKTTGRFAGSLLLGGSMGMLFVSSLMLEEIPFAVWMMALLGVMVKSMVEINTLLPARNTKWSTQKKSALIQLMTLRRTLLARWGLLAACVALMAISPLHFSFAVGGLICLLIGEFLERQLFFQAVETLKMPGNLKR